MNTLVIPVTLLELDECFPIALLELDECFPITVDGDRAIEIELDSRIVASEGTYYGGSYEVTPRAQDDVILPTEGHIMSDDVTVRRIPYFETSNLTGKTAYIADEVNYGN